MNSEQRIVNNTRYSLFVVHCSLITSHNVDQVYCNSRLYDRHRIYGMSQSLNVDQVYCNLDKYCIDPVVMSQSLNVDQVYCNPPFCALINEPRLSQSLNVDQVYCNCPLCGLHIFNEL